MEQNVSFLAQLQSDFYTLGQDFYHLKKVLFLCGRADKLALFLKAFLNNSAERMMQIRLLLEDKLQSAFHLTYLEVINESHKHNVPKNSETHFRVVLVSQNFEGMGRVKRHQQVYAILANELQNGIHALALKTYTPQEWQDSNHHKGKSPQCLGRSNEAVETF